MKKVTAATLMALLPGFAQAECVPQSVLTWVDQRESVAISPTRWQNVRKTLLGQDDGMSLAEMETIYNRRVANNWAAGHWTPIIAAVKCLEAEAPQALQGDSMTAREETVDYSAPPPGFAYFDSEANGVYAWKKWGPWADLDLEVRKDIHNSVDLDWGDLAEETYGSTKSRIWNTNPQFPDTTTLWTWRGDFVEYVLYPSVEKHWNLHGAAPQMVFEYNPSARNEWLAYIEYTRDNGSTVAADYWYGVRFENGAIVDSWAGEGKGVDGLTAQFYTAEPTAGNAAEDDPDSLYLVGEVRRAKIIGTFVTGVGSGS